MPQLKLSNRDRLNPHGKQIVDLLGHGGLESLGDFIKLWRTNFITTMQPKHLPSGWHVDHTIMRDFGKDSIFNKNGEEEEDE